MGNGLVGFLLFVWLALLFITGLTVFTGGFLLKRSVVSQNSTCAQNWIVSGVDDPPSSIERPGCWLPSRYNKAVIILIDGLRYDFAAYDGEETPFHNKMTIFQELVAQRPRHSSLSKFVADPPTTTMQRIKAIITGSLPTFIDVSDNFASFEIEEDNLIDQLVSLRKKVVFLGDDTWVGLLPGRFHRSHPFPSFNVKDLDTVDDGILKNLVPLIRNGSEWDVIVAHFLGVDHCGHIFGPNHPEMTRKLTQMNDVIESVAGSLDDETVLFVFGDHGMTKTGDHGGDSSDEIESALFVFSTGRPLMSRRLLKRTEVNQIDFATTFSLLLGLPIPFGNLGMIIPEFFELSESNLDDVKALYLNAKQVELYLRTYSSISEDFTSRNTLTNDLNLLMVDIGRLWMEFASNGSDISKAVLLKAKCVQYLSGVQRLCRETWAKFDLCSIILGLLVTAIALILTLLTITRRVTVSLISAFALCALGLLGTLSALHALKFPVFSSLVGLEFCFVIVFVSVQVVESYFLLSSSERNRSLGLRSNFLALVVGFLLFCLYFSNSYVINEDSATTFLAVTMLWSSLLSQRQKCLESGNEKKRKMKSSLVVSRNTAVSIVAVLVASVCIRFTSVSWKCREEQWWCEGSPFLQPQMSSIPSDGPEHISHKNLRLLLSLSSLATIVLATRWLLRKAGNLNGFSPTVLCASYCPIVMGFGIVFYWAMQGLTTSVSLHVMPNFASVVPNTVILVALFGLFVLFVRPLCIHETVEPTDDLGSLRLSGDQELLVPQVYRHLRANWEKHLHSSAKISKQKPLIVYGLATVFSAAQLVVVTIVVLLFVLVSRDGYSMSYALLFVAIGAVLHSYSLQKTSEIRSGECHIWDVPWSWVVLWCLLSSVGFYATGHQQTFPSIYWDAATVGSDGNFTGHTIPALKVLFNTYSSTIIFGVCLPFLLLWPISRQVVFKSGESGTAAEFEKGEFVLLDNAAFFDGLHRLSRQYLAVHGIKLLGCMSAAALHRRHLMVWKIFAPRFVFEALNLVMLFSAVLFCHLLVYSVHRSLQRWLNEHERKQG